MAEQIQDRRSESFSDRNTWLRALFMLVFAAVFYIAAGVLAAVAVLQLVCAHATGESNERLRGFGEQLARYLYQMVRFLTFRSDDKPWPFMDWPSDSEKQPGI